MLKLVNQERISAKEGGEAKEQFSKVINDLVTVKEVYLAFWKVFVIILSMFHGQSVAERGFNTNSRSVSRDFLVTPIFKMVIFLTDTVIAWG